ncbi:MAG: hypothetical protein EXR09_00305 [Acetobacteraceae bacterium]|nr:hypothetical protein [Acetobacteraceae bacterium]
MTLPPSPPSSYEPLRPLLDAQAANRLSRQVETATWGLIFVWLGLTWFASLGGYWGMVGLGAIFLGEAIFQGMHDLKISGMAMLFGLLFLAGGLWGVASAPFALLPALFVLFGVALVWRAVMTHWRRR